MSLGRLLLYLLTAISFLMVAFAILVEPPPLWVPVVLFVVYFAVIGWGVMDLRLGMFHDAICELREAKGAIALTFDDGPDPVGTRLVLDQLKKHGAHATFFLVGKKVEQHPEVAREIARAGHTIGVHSFRHERLYALLPPTRVKDDIQRTRDVIHSATGVRPIWFRPPVGQMSPRTSKGVTEAGATVIGWSVRALDGLRRTTDERCRKRVLPRLRDGAIVLFHDSWETAPVRPESGAADAPAGVRILGDVLVACKEAGLRPVNLEELLEATPRSP